MADLASEGNTAARLLLSQIDLLPSNGSEFLDSLSKKDRRLLFRSNEGAFGKSWLSIEGKSDPLAQALLDWRYIDKRMNSIPILLEKGETQIAIKAIILQAQQGDGSLMKLGELIDIPRSARHYFWLEALSVLLFSPDKATEREKAYVNEATEALKQGDLSAVIWYSSAKRDEEFLEDEKRAKEISYLLRGREFWPDYSFDPMNLNDFESVLMDVVWYETISQPCARICPKDPMQCTRAAYGALGGHDGAIRQGSPLQTLIPEKTYIESQRAEVQLARSLRQPTVDVYQHKIRNISVCLADHVAN